MRFPTICLGVGVVAFAAAYPATADVSSLWVDEVPSYVRPYAIQRHNIPTYNTGQQALRLPVTGGSSGGAFTLLSNTSPRMSRLAVLPHTHRAHHENFLCAKGRYQLWTSKDGIEETRILSKGDYGAVPFNTTHTYQFLDPDSEATIAIFPGGFEELFYFLSDRNLTFPSHASFDPSLPDSSNSAGGNSAADISSLERFDVYAQLDYSPRQDAIDGSAPPESVWRTGENILPGNTNDPFFIANDFGPKYLNAGTMGYHVIQPIVTPVQSEGNFTISKISISRLLPNSTVPTYRFEAPLALEIFDGKLSLEVGLETINLLEGDVVFLPAGTSFRYWSQVAFTRFLHLSTGEAGLATDLIATGTNWTSPMWPIWSV